MRPSLSKAVPGGQVQWKDPIVLVQFQLQTLYFLLHSLISWQVPRALSSLNPAKVKTKFREKVIYNVKR